jgi:predicted SAM-dependent methyltransferase
VRSLNLQQGPVRVNLGCGAQVPDGWINVDYALGARLARIPLFRKLNKRLAFFDLDWDDRIVIHDLTKPFPWKDSSVDVVYSSHTLEHMFREQGARFLAECHRVLRTDGLIRIVVPDLSSFVQRYAEGQIEATRFVEQLGVLYGGSKSRAKRWMAALIEFPHKCMYDSSSLVEALQQAGFAAECREPFDSDIADVGQVELEVRTVEAAIVEGRKQ